MKRKGMTIIMIYLENVSYKYPQNSSLIINNLSACFKRGEITAISGKNGSGKTTLTKLLAGMLIPTRGCITIDEKKTEGMDLFEIGQKVGYAFQNPNKQLFCDTAHNEIAFGLRNLQQTKDKQSKKYKIHKKHDNTVSQSDADTNEKSISEISDRYLSLFGLDKYRDTYPGKLSLGEKQRLVLAAVLALGTSYLVLDEPTTGLDLIRQRELCDILTNLRDVNHCGIVIVSHDIDFVNSFADSILYL